MTKLLNFTWTYNFREKIVLKIKRMLFYNGAKLKHEKHQSRHEKH